MTKFPWLSVCQTWKELNRVGTIDLLAEIRTGQFHNISQHPSHADPDEHILNSSQVDYMAVNGTVIVS